MTLAKWLTVFLVALALVQTAHSAPAPQERGASAAAEKLNVHLIAHTHDDVGWLKTVDQYYYGGNTSQAEGAVQYIIDSVVSELSKDETKRFIYVEIAFFYRWWREQDNATKAKVMELVSEGRLEFINGGWCMNDEAATHYNAIIDQMTLGHSFIESEFGAGAYPRVAWQIDPFGHSSVQADLFAEMSFDGLFFARNDYEDKALRLNQSRLEMVWRGSPKNRGSLSDLFTGIFHDHYSAPSGFCFDQRCGNRAVMRDDKQLEDYNTLAMVNAFVEEITEYSKSYRTNNIIVPMGDDFNYENAHEYFKNTDKLLKYLAEDGRVNAFYSTPSKYLEAVNAEGLEWELKTDDFFPYANAPHHFWTGYFTSRPSLKRYVRTSNSLLQTCKQVEAISRLNTPLAASPSATLRQAMGVAQHHDAVSGTEKEHVANDYAKRLSIGSAQCEAFLSDWATQMSGNSSSSFFNCRLLNVSVCEPLNDAEPFDVFLYNPLAHSRITTVRIPVNRSSYDVDGAMWFQVFPVSASTQYVRGSRGKTEYELVLRVALDSMSTKTVRVKSEGTDEKKAPQRVARQAVDPLEDQTIENSNIQLTFSSDTGHLSKITRLDSGLSIDIDQQIFWYQSDNKISNSYVFKPVNNTLHPVNNQSNKAVLLNVVKKDNYQEMQQQFSPWVYQTFRIYDDQKFAELEYTVGPVPFSDKISKEIISRFDTNLKSEGVFYTDANGRDMQVSQCFIFASKVQNMGSG